MWSLKLWWVANVSPKSKPSTWVYPLATNLALFLVTTPSSYNLMHTPTLFQWHFGWGVSLRTKLHSVWSCSNPLAWLSPNRDPQVLLLPWEVPTWK
jgi:hypothetical protein